MEEDIKILEDFINNEFQKDKLEMNEKGGFKIGTIYKVAELSPAIEKLIKGYRNSEDILKEIIKKNLEYKQYVRELEEENSGLKLDRRNLLRAIEKIKHTTPLNIVTETNYSINIDNDYIPKSKVKEIMKEIEKTNFNSHRSEYDDGNEAKNYILAKFRELMEEK